MNTVDRKYLRLTFDHATHCMTMSPFLGFVFFDSGGLGGEGGGCVWVFCFGLGCGVFLVGWVFLFGLGVFSVCVK